MQTRCWISNSCRSLRPHERHDNQHWPVDWRVHLRPACQSPRRPGRAVELVRRHLCNQPGLPRPHLSRLFLIRFRQGRPDLRGSRPAGRARSGTRARRVGRGRGLITHDRQGRSTKPRARNPSDITLPSPYPPSAEYGTDALGCPREIVRRLGVAPDGPVCRLSCEIADVIS